MKIANSNLPHLYLAPPLGVMSLEFRRYFWHQKTRVPVLLYGVVSTNKATGNSRSGIPENMSLEKFLRPAGDL